VHPIGIDAPSLDAMARSHEVRSAERELARATGDMKLIVRVDRMEPTKNIRRGFDAFGLVLRGHPEWRRRVRFLALLNPSRRGLPEYRAYAESCLAAADRVNDAFGDGGWQPVEARVRDDLTAAVAAYRRYDVLMVNSTIDGMNLVAKEGPSLNRRGGALVLSENAGAVAELGRHALVVNPVDVGETADAIRSALEMPQEERARRARGLRRAATRMRPDDWVRAQLEDLGPWGPATVSPRSPRPG
jgi:trehalose 6-phosphate synthase